MNGDGSTAVPTMVAITEPTALEVINRSEMDVQVATAHRFPRSLHEFRALAETMATLDQETAESCYYQLQRRASDGSMAKIEGKSVRFAEICASAFGNIRYGARIISVDDRSVSAQGYAHDLERNNRVDVEVRRSIVTKAGRRYSDDMITVTANAACSIACRNALLKVIPETLTAPVYAAARRAAVGDQKTLAHRRGQAIEHFKKLGVPQDRILARLEKTGVEDINLDDLTFLNGLKTALKEGEISLAEAFPVEEAATEETGDRGTQLAERIKRHRQARQDPGKDERQADEPGANG